MSFDQNITYKVNVDDSQFQAKLTQMRASLDATMGGGPSVGFGGPAMFGMMNTMSNFGPSTSFTGGFADFGSQIRPVTYTPPAIAMQPHFGMYQIHQNLRQAGLGSLGLFGMGINQMIDQGITSQQEMISPRISAMEYQNASIANFSDRMGSMAAAGLQGAGSLGLSIGLGALGTSVGSSLFSSAAGRMVGGLAGGIGLATAGAQYALAVADRVAGNVGIQTALEAGSFRFYQGQDSDRLTGRGFSRQSRMSIANAIQDMEARDNRFNTADYQQILEGGMQMDLFSGTRNADDFKKKFKDLVESVKTVSSTLHTSLKEGLETIRGMRDMGVTDPGAQTKMILQSEAMGRMSGRTGMEMMAIGQTGAELFRGTGISMQKGFDLAQQNVTMVKSMLNQGLISRETVAQAGGENSLGQQMTANALASFQTLQGRGAMMAFYNSGTNSFDPDMLSKMMSGNTMGILTRAAEMGFGDRMKLQANQEEIISKMSPMEMQLFGMGQRMMSARMIGGAFGGDLETNFINESKRQGVSMEQIKTELAMAKQDPEKMRADMEKQLQAIQAQQAMEQFREKFGAKAIGNAFTRALVDPIKNIAVDVREGVAETIEGSLISMAEGFTGVRTTAGYLTSNDTVSAGQKIVNRRANDVVQAQNMLRQASGQGAMSMEEEARMRAAAGKGSAVVDLTQGAGLFGLFGSDRKEGAAELASQIVATSKDTGVVLRKMDDATAEKMRRETGETLIKLRDGQYATASDIGKLVDMRRKLQVSDEEVDKQARNIDPNIKNKISSMENATIDQVGQVVLGKDFSRKKLLAGDYSKEDVAKLNAYARASAAGQAQAFLKENSNTDVLDVVANSVSGELGAIADRKINEAGAMLGGTGLNGEQVNRILKSDAKDEFAALLQGGGDRGAFRSALVNAGMSAKDIDAIMQRTSSMNATDSQKNNNKQAAKLIEDALAMSAISKNAVSDLTNNKDGKGPAFSGAIGSLSATNFEALSLMAKQLENQIKLLDTLHKQFAQSMKQAGK